MMEVKKFVNPYNFIPLPKEKKGAYEDPDRHTGVITYQITTKTPLFIPNTSNDNAFLCTTKDHKSYDFFSYHELETGVDHREHPQEPVIPGSELRGMIRGIYETLTNSCMGVFNEELYPERRTGDVFKPGLIRRTVEPKTKKVCYQLYKAKSYQYSNAFGTETVTQYSEGKLLYFNGKRTTTESRGKEITVDQACNISTNLNEKGKKKGYLIKGEAFGKRKKHCYIFEVPKNAEAIMQLDDGAVKRLEAVLDSYRSQPKQEKFYEEYQTELKKFLKGNGNEYFPVRYSMVEDSANKDRNAEQKKLLYLSPAAITKEIANTPLKDILGDFSQCEIYQKRCPACDLFGMIGSDHTEAIGSRVRFSDARVTDVRSPEKYYDEILTRETLGGPKLSNPEFYLQRPQGASAWNYDYYIQDGQIHLYSKKVPLKLRGRKYYVHQPDVEFPKNVEPSKLNATIRPLKTGVTFEGKLYFENISQKQIDQMIWILNGGSKEDIKGNEHLWYKLGSGKPLGFGSVELQVVSCEERIVSMEGETLSYQTKPLPIEPKSYDQNEFGRIVTNDFIRINTPDYAKSSEVTYPSVAGGIVIGTTVEKGFEWFMVNKGNGVTKREKAEIKTVLPLISQKYLKQYELEKKDKNKNGKPYDKKNFGKKNYGNNWKK